MIAVPAARATVCVAVATAYVAMVIVMPPVNTSAVPVVTVISDVLDGRRCSDPVDMRRRWCGRLWLIRW